MEINKVTGANLRRMRIEAGLTQEELAHYLGVVKQNVSAMEHGRRGLSGSTLTRLCEVFACAPSEFFQLAPDQQEGIDKLLSEEVGKMDRAGKARLYAAAVAMNS